MHAGLLRFSNGLRTRTVFIRLDDCSDISSNPLSASFESERFLLEDESESSKLKDMPSKKRPYSTYALAKKFGLLQRPKVGEIEIHTEYQGLDQFQTSEFEFSVPKDSAGLISLAKTLEKIHNDLNNLEDSAPCSTELGNLRRCLLNLFVSDSAYMCEKIVVEANDGSTTSYIFDTEIFITIEHVTLRLISDRLIDVTCNEFEFIGANLLINGRCYDKPILQFSINEVMDAVWLLSEKWHELHYSEEITYYLELLQCRIAMLYFQPLDETASTKLTRSKMEEIGWAIRDMYKKLYIHQYVSRNMGTPLPKFSKEDRKRVYDLCIDTDTDEELQTPFMLFCLKYITQPGALRAFSRDKPQKEARQDKVLKYVWGERERINTIAEWLAYPLKRFIQENKMGDAIRDLALLYLIDTYASNVINGSFSGRFVLVYESLFNVMSKNNQLEVELRERKYPVLIQSFNWIGLYNYPYYYHHENVIDAFLHWLMIVSQPPWNMKVEGTSMEDFNIRLYQFSRLLKGNYSLTTSIIGCNKMPVFCCANDDAVT